MQLGAVSSHSTAGNGRAAMAMIAGLHYECIDAKAMPLLSTCMAEDLKLVLAGMPVMDIPFQSRLQYYLLHELHNTASTQYMQVVQAAKAMVDLYGEQPPKPFDMRTSPAYQNAKKKPNLDTALNDAFNRMTYTMRFEVPKPPGTKGREPGTASSRLSNDRGASLTQGD